jgi:hypothetical protein
MKLNEELREQPRERASQKEGRKKRRVEDLRLLYSTTRLTHVPAQRALRRGHGSAVGAEAVNVGPSCCQPGVAEIDVVVIILTVSGLRLPKASKDKAM